jgi:hypothetical protein
MNDRALILGTSYLHGAAAAETFRMWATMTLKLNPGTDILVVDSGSPMEVPYFAPPMKYKLLEDNIGHLHRGGKDGWGRAFATGITHAIEHEYDWVANIECDILFARPVSEIIDKMARHGVVCAAPMAMPYQFTETGLSFWSVPYLKEHDVIGRYDWQNPPNTTLLPEQRIDAICAGEMFALPLRGMRNDMRVNPEQLQRMFPQGIDWLTHSDLPCLRRFMEMNKLEMADG